MCATVLPTQHCNNTRSSQVAKVIMEISSHILQHFMSEKNKNSSCNVLQQYGEHLFSPCALETDLSVDLGLKSMVSVFFFVLMIIPVLVNFVLD
jgi:ferric iron reductase protein FhuF